MSIGVYCCKDCIPPKRHSGCHATCKEYKDKKAQYEEAKKKFKVDMENIPRLTDYDFNEIVYANSKRHKHKSKG